MSKRKETAPPAPPKIDQPRERHFARPSFDELAAIRALCVFEPGRGRVHPIHSLLDCLARMLTPIDHGQGGALVWPDPRYLKEARIMLGDVLGGRWDLRNR